MATNVWNVNTDGLSDAQAAHKGLETMEAWMRELGLAMNITECGASSEIIEGIADACPINDGGYKVLERKDVINILKNSL